MSGGPATESRVGIVGLACRLPGAASVNQFWLNLCAGTESIRPLSKEEMLAAGLREEDLDDPRHVSVGATLDDIDRFDAAFFGIAAREAELMDPQQRVFLECAWEALENAGCDPARFDGAIGVFGGANFNSYLAENLQAAGVFDDKSAILQAILANDKDYLATRVAYKLNLRGPAFTVQSGCSTSLVAVHLGTQSLLNHECDLALAGGVAIDVTRKQGYWSHEGSVFSPDGHVRAFDAGAQGTVFGNGVGIVVLKRLEDALRDGNTIYAVVLGSAVNNDGSVKVGFTAPSVVGQSEVITEALADAGVPPHSIGYVEAHGTGTPLGDPIEIEALGKAFGRRPPEARRCAIGSVKTNLGHLDCAAGVAGLIKTALALRHAKIPPSLNFSRPNPQIAFEKTPFFVNAALAPWPAGTLPGLPRRAGVSSFGMGGTNAHLVLEEARSAASDPAARSHELLIWSARTAAALERATANLRAYLRSGPAESLADVAFTLQSGRAEFAHRRTLTCASAADAVAAFDAPEQRLRTQHCSGDRNRPVAFLFPGQGAQYVGMGSELYESEPVYREAFEACRADFLADTGVDLRELVYPAGDEAGALAESRLQQTEWTQPALFAVEYALTQVWRSWGVVPAALLGHSLGEYVAACISGVFSRRDAMRVVARRGRLVQALEPGAMTAVVAAPETLNLSGALALAAVNGDLLSVISGAPADVERFEERLAASGVQHRRLHTERAFHSAMIEPVMRPFAAVFDGIRLSPPSIPFISNVTGRWIEAEEAVNPFYWAEHLRRTVRFSDGLQCLAADGPYHLVEVGPGRTLATFARQHRFETCQIVTSLPAARDGGSSGASMLDALGRLWQAGLPIDWEGVHSRSRRRRVPLPTYPFEKDRFWIEVPSDDDSPAARASQRKPDPADWFYAPTWRQTSHVELLTGRRRESRQTWLVLADESPFSREVVARLEAAADVLVATVGTQFRQTSPGRFSIDPRAARDYVALLTEADRAGRFPTAIVHLWTASERVPTHSSESIREADDVGFQSLVRLIRALDAQPSATPLSLRIVTANAQDVLGVEPLSLGSVTMLGAARVIPQERAHVDCACIDVDLAASADRPGSIEYLADRVCAELTLTRPDPFVAYRGANRWTQTCEQLHLPLRGGIPALLRERGVYVILGGLGRIGLTLAEHLGRKFAARLVLVGRTGLPDRAGWPAWLSAHADDDAVSFRIRRVQSMEAHGVELAVAAADAGDSEQLARVFSGAERRFGRIDGVISAAGIVDRSAFQPFVELTPEECRRQFHPKVDGLFALEQALLGRAPDFCLLISSLSSVLGGLGYGAYAAANVFMDAFARHENRQGGVRWMSVNWDAWRWTEAGDDVPGASLVRLAMSPSESVDAFDRLMCVTHAPQLVISTSDLAARLALWVEWIGARGAEQAPAVRSEPVAPAGVPEPAVVEAGGEPMRRLTATERTVIDIWRQVLGLDDVALNESFLDLGGSSLTAVQVISRLERALEVRIAIEEFIFQTAGQLATLCDQKRSRPSPAESAPARGGLLRSLRGAISGRS